MKVEGWRDEGRGLKVEGGGWRFEVGGLWDEGGEMRAKGLERRDKV